jgi:D-psicose/D-tagatose/L-ribulose 3-epimerase
MSAQTERPTLAACEWIFGERPLTETIAALAAAGYDALVITGEPDRPDVDEMKSLLDEAGLTIAGSTSETSGNPSRDLAHPDRSYRAEAVGYYRGCVDLLKRLDGPTLGIVPSAEGRLSAPSYQQAWKLAVEATREVALYAGEQGVSLAIEPLNRYEAFLVNRVEQACRFAAEVDIGGVGVIADFFHMNIEETDLFAAIERAGESLLEIHLADSNRNGLGTGHLPVRALLERVEAHGFRGTFAVECYVQAADDFEERSDAFLEQCARSVWEVFPG